MITKSSPLAAIWTFPSILLSAFLVAWGAEAAQFLMSQGLALAILAWLQTLPEFAVEAVIAWDAGREPERARAAAGHPARARACGRDRRARADALVLRREPLQAELYLGRRGGAPDPV